MYIFGLCGIIKLQCFSTFTSTSLNDSWDLRSKNNFYIFVPWPICHKVPQPSWHSSPKKNKKIHGINFRHMVQNLLLYYLLNLKVESENPQYSLRPHDPISSFTLISLPHTLYVSNHQCTLYTKITITKIEKCTQFFPILFFCRGSQPWTLKYPLASSNLVGKRDQSQDSLTKI